jgi:putative SOS response-associated peptidase YedK
MPAIIAPEDWPVWLGETETDASGLAAMLRPIPAAAVTAYPVGPAVGSVGNDGPELLAPAAGGLFQSL